MSDSLHRRSPSEPLCGTSLLCFYFFIPCPRLTRTPLSHWARSLYRGLATDRPTVLGIDVDSEDTYGDGALHGDMTMGFGFWVLVFWVFSFWVFGFRIGLRTKK